MTEVVEPEPPSNPGDLLRGGERSQYTHLRNAAALVGHENELGGDYVPRPTLLDRLTAATGHRDKRLLLRLAHRNANPAILRIHRGPLQAKEVALAESGLQRDHEDGPQLPEPVSYTHLTLPT